MWCFLWMLWRSSQSILSRRNVRCYRKLGFTAEKSVLVCVQVIKEQISQCIDANALLLLYNFELKQNAMLQESNPLL